MKMKNPKFRKARDVKDAEQIASNLELENYPNSERYSDYDNQTIVHHDQEKTVIITY